MASLCLNMIVRNEAAILARCLFSVAPWIDRYVVCDTGSTDGTEDLVRAFMSERGIPGEIVRAPFENFSQARNAALDAFRATRSSPDEYALLTDADMELRVDDPRFKDRLGARSAYLLRQRGGFSYDNVRLVRADSTARYRGATHEYLDTGGDVERLEGAWFVDHADGSSRPEKFERDSRLLLAELEVEPTNARAMFYLAQTFKDMGRFEDAIRWYERRVQAGGWDEEIWYSLYMIASCYRSLGDEASMLRSAMTAFQKRPTRSEPLLLLATYYRERGDNDVAMLMARTGIGIPYPSDQLFIDDYVYHHGFRYETSIVGFYALGERERARRLCFDLATDRGTPAFVRERSRSNSIHYTRSLAETAGAEVSLYRITLPDDPIFVRTNPSIATDGERLHAIVRGVNYSIVDGRYVIRDESDAIRTQNTLVELDARGEVGRAKTIEDSPETSSGRTDFSVQGYEDCRLFFWRGRRWATATVRDRHPSGLAEIALLEIADDGEIARVRHMRVLEAPVPGQHEKNWVPVVERDRLRIVYHADPTIVLEVDPVTLRAREISRSVPESALDHLRGGSQAIPLDGRWIYLAHEAFDEGRRSYTHRFVALDGDLRVRGVSDPFYIMRPGIEFAAGLCRVGDELILSFGSEDKQAWIARVNADAVARAIG